MGKLTLANNPLASGPALEQRGKGGVPYREVKLSSIERDPSQPRQHFDEERLNELAQSIGTYGVLSPILIRPGKIPGKYRLVAGERRVRAARIAGLTTIPAIVDSASDEEEDRIIAIQLIENIQRADLNPLDRATAIGLLRDSYGLSIREIASRLGVSKSMVQRSLELLQLPDDLLEALKNGASESKVLLVSKIADPEDRRQYLEDLDSMSRSSIKDAIKEKAAKPKSGAPANRKNANIVTPEDQRIADEMQRTLGLRVRLHRAGELSESGKLTIDFYSEDDLQVLFRKLMAE